MKRKLLPVAPWIDQGIARLMADPDSVLFRKISGVPGKHKQEEEQENSPPAPKEKPPRRLQRLLFL